METDLHRVIRTQNLSDDQCVPVIYTYDTEGWRPDHLQLTTAAPSTLSTSKWSTPLLRVAQQRLTQRTSQDSPCPKGTALRQHHSPRPEAVQPPAERQL